MKVTIWAEAFIRQRVAMSSLANVQARRRVNAEKAPKKTMREPILPNIGKGRRPLGRQAVGLPDRSFAMLDTLAKAGIAIIAIK
ncbi:MAG: hypothetical protein OXC69_10655 [Candidatus Tectomicrobia bacterium]|nr:hypothetical protein [Candidatus Tectomicrobia bacterium]